jgi:UDP-N-acetylmuramoyl-L-alanyl-D-glutamate--2,6-diaminopimelate ligase
MGKVAADMADRVVVTSDNPRTENAGAIIAEIRAGIPASTGATISVEPDREAAIRLAIGAAKLGDTIIIAGKGHEDYQILPDPQKRGATITRHFDDRQVARAALRERGIGVREPAKRLMEEDNGEGGDLTAGASLALGG